MCQISSSFVYNFFTVVVFIYLWLCWVFIAAWAFSLVAVLKCIVVASLIAGTSSRHVGSVVAAPRVWSTGSVVVVPGLSRSMARGIFLDQKSNLCLLHWQSDSLLLSHHKSSSVSNV